MSLADQTLRQNKPNPILRRILSTWDSSLLILIIIGVFLPVFLDGWPQTADGTLHLYRLSLLTESIQEGVLYPRWMPDLVLGFGYPLLHFYAPAAYYVGVLLSFIGLSSSQALVGTFFVFTFVAGFGMRALALDLFSNQQDPLRRWQALIAATAYVFAPYLLTNIYVRGAIAELGAQALIPWVFWSFGHLVKHENPERYFLSSSILLALLAITHNISLLFIPPALLAYLVILFRTNRWKRAKWVSAAGLTALGLSAFFWLPVLMERNYLAETAYEQAKGFIIEHTWTLNTFLDSALRFQYSSIPPFRLGLMQVILALFGFVLARRLDREWLFWLLLALIGGFAISRFSAPIWQANEILLVAQFPWRLLIIITPVLALFTAGLLSPLQNRSTHMIGGTAVILLVVIIAGNWPSYPWSLGLRLVDIEVTPGNLAHFEKEIGALGTSSSREFMPRWVNELDMRDENASDSTVTTITLHEATSTEMTFTVTNNAVTPIRWTNFYFPGWRVTMKDGTELTPFPSTPAGLMTVEVPAGTHQISLSQTGTGWQHTATMVSVITAVIILVFIGYQSTRIPWWVPPVAFIIFWGLLLLLPQNSTSPLITPEQADESSPVQLLGFQSQQKKGFLKLTPYWFIRQHVTSFQPVWQLKSKDGTLITSLQSSPYFDTSDHIEWQPGTIVDDAYLLPLPADLPADTYFLEMAVSADAPLLQIGEVTLPGRSNSNQRADNNPPAVVFGEEIALIDFELEINGKTITDQTIPVVYPGDQIQYTLFWQARQPPEANYRGTLHLTDENWQTLMQNDQHLGKVYNFSRLWHPNQIQKDFYRFVIPSDKPNGLYWPRLGVYDIIDGKIIGLEAINNNGLVLGKTHTLPALKVLNNPEPVKTVDTDLKINDIGKLIGYDLILPLELAAGDTISLTLSFLSTGTSPVDYSRFVHLYSPEHGLIAQIDGTPQNGINPTSVWTEGEIVNDLIYLTIPDGSPPGKYQLFTGLYNPLNGSRLPILNTDGRRLENNQILIAEVIIQ